MPTIHSEYRSQSFEFNDTIALEATGRSTSACSRATTRSTARACARTSIDALRLRRWRRAHKYKMYEIPFSKMMQPRLGATWAYNGRTPCSRATRSTTRRPARCRAPRRGTATSATTINALLRRQRRTCSPPTASASSSGKLFVPDMTPRTINEYLVGTARQFGDRLDRPRSTAATAAARTTGRTPTTPRGSRRSTRRAGIPHETLYIPNLTAHQLAQIGQRLDLRHRRARRRVHEVLRGHVEARVPRAARRFFRGSYTWSHYYGNFDQDNSSARPTTRTSSSARRTSATAPGRQLWDIRDGDAARRSAERVQGLRLVHPATGTRRPAPSSSRSRASRGRAGTTSSTAPHDVSTSDTIRYAEPAGSRAHRRALPAGPELHAEHAARAAATTRRSRSTCSTSSTQPDRLQHPAAVSTARRSAAAELLRSAAAADRVPVPVLKASQSTQRQWTRHVRTGRFPLAV